MKNLIAIGILVVLGIVAALTFREEPDTEKEKVVASITPVDADKVDKISVERLDGFGDKKTEEKYTLEKKDGVWRMTAPVDYAVVQSTVESMTKALSELRVIDVISEKADAHEKFAVDDKAGIKLKALSGDQVLLYIVIGNAKSGITFARLPGKNEVYRMKGSFKFNVDRSIKTLREKAIVNMEMDDLEKVTFKQGEKSLTLIKDGEGSDVKVKPEGQEIPEFDDSKATSVVRSTIRLNAVDFVDEKLPVETTGLDVSADSFTVTGKRDDKPYTVTVFLGNKMEEKSQVYARNSESDQVFLVSKFTADRLRANEESLVKEAKPASAGNAPVAGNLPLPKPKVPVEAEAKSKKTDAEKSEVKKAAAAKAN